MKHWPWNHRWEAFRVDHGKGRGSVIGDVSLVYERCACGEVRSRILSGRWELSDFSGAS